MAEFESNQVNSIDKNAVLFNDNNDLLQKILSSLNNNSLIDDNAEDIAKSLNHIDKRMLGSMKNKTNIILEDIFKANIDQLKLLNFLSDRILDITKFSTRAEYKKSTEQSLSDEQNLNFSPSKDIPNILYTSLDTQIGIYEILKKVYDNQKDSSYRAGRGRPRNENSDENSALKNKAKELELLNDIAEEKKRAEELKKDSGLNGIMNPRYLETAISGATAGIGSAIGAALSNPGTWAVLGTIIAGAYVGKKITELTKTYETARDLRKGVYNSVKDTEFQGALSQSVTTAEKITPFAVKGTIENQLLIKDLQQSKDALQAFSKEILIINDKQKNNIALTNKEIKLKEQEQTIRQKLEIPIVDKTVKLREKGIDLSDREKGIIGGAGYTDFSKDLDKLDEMLNMSNRRIYGEQVDITSLNTAIQKGLTTEIYDKLINVSAPAVDPIFGQTGIGKSTEGVNENLKLFNQNFEIFAKKISPEKYTEAEQNAILKGASWDGRPQYNIPGFASGGTLPTKGTAIVGENNPEFIKNNKVISPIGKTSQTNMTTIEKTISDSMTNNLSKVLSETKNGNENISRSIIDSNNKMMNLFARFIESMNNPKQSNGNTINNITSQPQSTPPTSRNNNPYRDTKRVSNIE